MKRKPDSRTTKQPKAKPEVTANRVEQICDLMRVGQWVRGETEDVLAEAWGLSASRVRELSAEAWRRVCAEADNPKAARPEIVGTLLLGLQRAMAAGKYGDVARLADVWTKIIGAREPEEHRLMSMTEEQALAKYRELTGQDWGAKT